MIETSGRPLYDRIGGGYRDRRVPDPRVGAALALALGGARRVLNVGAGVGSYEPAGPRVTALEPSSVMLAQRRADAAPAVRGVAESLPFADGAFDAAMTVLSLHHWSDYRAGLREMRRVAPRVVLLTWVGFVDGFWLLDYFPEIEEIDRDIFPSVDEMAALLGPITSTVLPIPHDCSDGFLCAYWQRPEAYLDPAVRGAISTLARLQEPELGLARLRDDLRSGEWQRRYGELYGSEQRDYGYRVMVAEG